MTTYLNIDAIEDGSIPLAKLEEIPSGGGTGENTTYTFTGGTNKITVKPSNASAYDVNITPEVAQSNITWGGGALEDNISVIGAAMSDEISANRLAFMNPLGIDVKYSSNGGSTYTDAGLADSEKVNFVTSLHSVNVGPEGTVTTDYRTQVTFTAVNADTNTTYVYTRPKKMLLYVTTYGHTINVKIEYASHSNPDNWETYGTYPLSGWSGWNDIPLQLSTFGGYYNQPTNNWYLRLTFSVEAVSTSSSYATSRPTINSIRLFGDTAWTTTSNYGNNGHLYSFDWQQNATFPSKLNAVGFYESSDERLKNFSKDIDLDLEKLSKLKKMYFTWKDDDKQQFGVSAQEVQKIYPEIVSADTETGNLSVDYAKLSVVALAAVDKLYDRQKSIEDRLAKLENR